MVGIKVCATTAWEYFVYFYFLYTLISVISILYLIVHIHMVFVNLLLIRRANSISLLMASLWILISHIVNLYSIQIDYLQQIFPKNENYLHIFRNLSICAGCKMQLRCTPVNVSVFASCRKLIAFSTMITLISHIKDF